MAAPEPAAPGGKPPEPTGSDRRKNGRQRQRRVPFSGILLVFVGLLFLADTLELFAAESIIADWWPAILMVIGLDQIINSRGGRSGGVTVLLVGAVMLAFTVGPFEWSDFGRFWPVLLIIIGAWIIFKPRRDV